MKKIIISILCISVSAAANTWGMSTSGRFSIDNYYSKDSSMSHDFNITNIRLRIDMADINDKRLAFHFSGLERIKGSKSDIGDHIPTHRIDSMNIEYLSFNKTLNIKGGRQSIVESAGVEVDGINAGVNLNKNSLAGLFGGLKPDPYARSFNTNYTTTGLYYQYKGESFFTGMGFVYDGYKLAADREYSFLNVSYLPITGTFRLNSSAILDLADNIDFTTLNIGGDVRPYERINISLHYSQFKAVKLKKSMSYNIDRHIQNRVELGFDYRLYQDIKTYIKYIYRYRGSDSRYANSVSLGFRGDIPALDAVYFDVKYTKERYFLSDNSSVFIELNTPVLDDINLGSSFEYQSSKGEMDDNAVGTKIFNLFADYNITKYIYVNINYEYTTETAFTTHSLFTKFGIRF